MNHIESCHNILKSSTFFEDFKDMKILYKKNGELVSSFEEFNNNIARVFDIKKSQDLKIRGDAWEFFSLFYMIYERNLICRNIQGDFKKFKIDDVISETNDYGIDFYISHNSETIGVQCKYNADTSIDLDPRKSKLANFISNNREKTRSKYYILITSRDLHYSIEDMLKDSKNFYYINLKDMANDNIDINFFESFKKSILNEPKEISIIENNEEYSLEHLEPKMLTNIVPYSRYRNPLKQCKKYSNIYQSKDRYIENIICQYIMLNFFKYLGPVSYDSDLNCTLVKSEEYNKLFIIKYHHTKSAHISANASLMTEDLVKMKDLLNDDENYEPMIIYVSNVDSLFDVTLSKMSNGKVFGVINYEKLLTSYQKHNELENTVVHFSK